MLTRQQERAFERQWRRRYGVTVEQTAERFVRFQVNGEPLTAIAADVGWPVARLRVLLAAFAAAVELDMRDDHEPSADA